MLMSLLYVLVLIPLSFYCSVYFFIYIYFFFFIFLFLMSSDFFFCSISYIFGLDIVSYIFCCLSVWICILIVYSMYNYYLSYGFHNFILCVNFLLFSLICVFCVYDFFYFFFFFEFSLIPLFLIIFGWGYQPERLSAGFFLIFYTLFGSLPFFLSILLINSLNGGFFYFYNFKIFGDLIMFFMVFSFMIKFPMFGVHLWLPSAHVEAPVSGSMILAGVMLKLGGYGLFRMIPFLYNFFYFYSVYFILFSLFGCLICSLYCLVQSDLKILIAYSSVCHMGMVISGMFTMMSWSILGSLAFMIGHGFVSSALFFLIGLIYDRLGSRSFYFISGMINFLPSLSLFWFLFCCMNMGCPPSINLFSEISLVFGLLSWSMKIYFFLFFILFFSACYSLTIFFLTQHGVCSSLLKFISFCSLREYYILFLHLYPGFMMMFDMFFFFF